MASQARSDTIDVAEEAFAAINQYDKVFYIQNLKVHDNTFWVNLETFMLTN